MCLYGPCSTGTLDTAEPKLSCLRTYRATQTCPQPAFWLSRLMDGIIHEWCQMLAYTKLRAVWGGFGHNTRLTWPECLVPIQPNVAWDWWSQFESRCGHLVSSKVCVVECVNTYLDGIDSEWEVTSKKIVLGKKRSKNCFGKQIKFVTRFKKHSNFFTVICEHPNCLFSRLYQLIFSICSL